MDVEEAAHHMASMKPTPATTLVPITEGPPVNPAILDLTVPTQVGSPAPYTISLEHQEVMSTVADLVTTMLASPNLPEENKQKLLGMQALLAGRLAGEQLITTLKRVNRQADKLSSPATPPRKKAELSAAVVQAMPPNPCQVIPNPEVGGGNPAVLHQAKAYFDKAKAGGDDGNIIDLPTILCGIKQSSSRNDPTIVQREMTHALRKLGAAADDAMAAGDNQAASEILANQARLVDVYNHRYLPLARLVGYDTANELVLSEALSTAAKDRGISVMTFASELAANPEMKKVIQAILDTSAGKDKNKEGRTSKQSRWWCSECKVYGHSISHCKKRKPSSEKGDGKSRKGQ